MLHGVSWSEYEEWVIAVVIIYYSITAFILYFPALSRQVFLAGKGFVNENRNREESLSENLREDIPAKNVETKEFNQDQIFIARQVSSEVVEIIYQAGEQKQLKKQLLARLNNIMMKYDSISDSKVKNAIDNLVKHQCETVCSICLNEEEQRMLWKGRAGGAFL